MQTIRYKHSRRAREGRSTVRAGVVMGVLAVATVIACALSLLAAAPAGQFAATAEKSASPTPSVVAAKSLPPEAKSPPADAKTNPGRTICGKLTPPDRVLEAYLWDRATDLKVPVTVDPKTGAFESLGLRLGTYDLIIKTPWGRLEGVDMAPKLSDYDVLIPPEYRTDDLGKSAGGTLSDDDRKDIHRIIYGVQRYENNVRDVYLVGSSDRAVALVALLMDQPFVGRKGDEITWRVEQWYYNKQYGAWSAFRTRVLYRFRVSKAAWETWGWQFEPALGGFDISEDRKEPVTVEFTIPEKPVAVKGLAGNQYPPVEKGALKEPPPKEES
jgi:hypothetical protein